MTKDELYDLCEKVEKRLLDNGILSTASPVYGQDNAIEVEINWGDWKHSHLRARWILGEEFDMIEVGEEVTESDGSDTYSAVHTYEFAEE